MWTYAEHFKQFFYCPRQSYNSVHQKGKENKQYKKLKEFPMLMYSIEKFTDFGSH